MTVLDAEDSAVTQQAPAPRARVVAIQALSVIFVGFHVYTAAVGALLPLQQRGVHVGLALALTFLIVPTRKNRGTFGEGYMNPLLAVVPLTITGYVVINSNAFNLNPAGFSTIDVVFGAVLTVVILEGARRTAGAAFAIITIAVLLYALYADHFWGIWQSQALSFDLLMGRLLRSNAGIWGSITGVSANEIAVLLVFSEILLAVGGLDAMKSASQRITGRAVGGPAKAAVLSSVMMGTISGSSAANAAMVGSFTIPFMKSAGYKARFAAGVEATASSFGQLTPPVMGAAAFLMAELLVIPYIDIAKAAVIPAAIVFASIFAGVHFYSRKVEATLVDPGRIDALPESVERNSKWRSLGIALPILLPLVVLVVMLVDHRSVQVAALYGAIASAGLFILTLRWRTGGWNLGAALLTLYHGVLSAARSIAMVGVLVVTAQIVVSLINVTALGVKLSNFLLNTTSGNAPLAFLITAVVCIILGMGLPTTAAYIVAAAVSANFLMTFDVEPLAVHLFIFYFAIISSITPPICVGVYVAAGIAKTSWFHASLDAMMLSMAKYVLPFLFVMQPALIAHGNWKTIVGCVSAVLVGAVMLEAAAVGHLRYPLLKWERVVIAACCLMLFTLHIWIALPGFVILATFVTLHYRTKQARDTSSAATPVGLLH